MHLYGRQVVHCNIIAASCQSSQLSSGANQIYATIQNGHCQRFIFEIIRYSKAGGHHVRSLVMFIFACFIFFYLCIVQFNLLVVTNKILIYLFIYIYLNKSCNLDPCPTILVKECIDILAKPKANIINLFLVQGNFPEPFKQAHVSPLLKRTLPTQKRL